MEANAFEESPANPAPAPSPANSPSTVPQGRSAAILRLMEEVRCEDVNVPSASGAYNRQHNRHNR
jgi:hypothetical protein